MTVRTWPAGKVMQSRRYLLPYPATAPLARGTTVRSTTQRSDGFKKRLLGDTGVGNVSKPAGRAQTLAAAHKLGTRFFFFINATCPAHPYPFPNTAISA